MNHKEVDGKMASHVEDTAEKRRKEIEERELGLCHLWVEGDFSIIPVALIEKAYRDSYDEIKILAPTFDDFRKKYREEYHCKVECNKCPQPICLEAYETQYPKIPRYNWVFLPKNPLDREWTKENADKVAECGFIVYKTREIGVYLGVNGAGYDFYKAHWLPLYRARGLGWYTM